jgi:hypothetical protein
MRAPLSLILSVLVAVPAAAQNTGAGGEGKQTYQNLRSFTVQNNSRTVVESVKLISTEGGQVMFQSPNPIRPNESSEAQVGRDQCLAEVDVTFKGGRTLQSTGLHDCKLTRISVGDDQIKPESAAVR